MIGLAGSMSRTAILPILQLRAAFELFCDHFASSKLPDGGRLRTRSFRLKEAVRGRVLAI